MEVVVYRITRDECRVRIRDGGWCRAVSWRSATVVAVYVGECFVVKTGALRLFVVVPGNCVVFIVLVVQFMPSFGICVRCGRRHNDAHQCPVFRLNCNPWIGAAAGVDLPPVPIHLLADFDVVCPHCRSRSWRGENINCCGNGRLQLPLQDDVPDELQQVLLSSHVRLHIRRYQCVRVFCVV